MVERTKQLESETSPLAATIVSLIDYNDNIVAIFRIYLIFDYLILASNQPEHLLEYLLEYSMIP